MNSQLIRFLESKGFKTTVSKHTVLAEYAKPEKLIIVEIISTSETDFHVAIRSTVAGNVLSIDKLICIAKSTMKSIDIVRGFQNCLNEFEQTLLCHVENVKSIHNIFR